MTAPGAPPRDRKLAWVLGGLAGCLVLLVVLVIVGFVVWRMQRPDDGDVDILEFPSATIDTTGWVEEEPVPVSGSRTLSGRVVDAITGAPVADAQITILGPSGVPHMTYTDASGNWSASFEETGSYMMTISAAGHSTGIYPNAFELTAETPAVAELEDIALQPE